jgi:WD40 repeat protein
MLMPNIVRDKEFKGAAENEIIGIDFNPKMKIIASIGLNCPVSIHQYPYMRLLKRIAHRERIEVQSEEEALELIEIHNTSQYDNEEEYQLDKENKVIRGGMIDGNCLTFSTNGQFLAIGYANGDFLCYNCSEWTKLAELHLNTCITSTQFINTDTQVFAMTEDWEYVIIDTNSWQITKQAELKVPNKGRGILSQDGNTIYLVSDKKRVQSFSLEPFEMKADFKGHKSGINGICLTPDGKILATSGNDRKIALFKSENGEFLGYMLGHEDEVHAIAFSADGQYLFSSSEDNNLRMWDWRQKKSVKMLDYTPNAFDMKIYDNLLVMGNVEGGIRTFKII